MDFANILCVLTQTQKADEVFSHALHNAQKYGTTLHVLLALEALPPSARMVMESASYMDSHESVVGNARRWLDNKLAEWQQDYSVTGEVSIGEPFYQVEEVCRQRDIDLVIKASTHDLLDHLFASDDMHLMRHCPSPTLLTHHALPHNYKNILVAVDANYHYSETEVVNRKAINQRLVNCALDIAQREETQCHIVSVFDVYPAALLGDGFVSVPVEALDEEAELIKDEQMSILQDLAKNSASSGLAHFHVCQGHARTELSKMAGELKAELVVMSTSARTGLPGLLLGNTCDSLLSELNCAVLAFKSA